MAAAVPWLAAVFAEPAHQMQRLRKGKQPARGGPEPAGSQDTAARQLQALQALLLMLPLPQVRWTPMQPVTTPDPDALLLCDSPAAVPAPEPGDGCWTMTPQQDHDILMPGCCGATMLLAPRALTSSMMLTVQPAA